MRFQTPLMREIESMPCFAGEAKSHWSEPVFIELDKQIVNVFLDSLYRIRYILRRSRC